MAGLWGGLSKTLARLESFAAGPLERLDAEAVEALSRLQYALHASSELAVGIEPPEGARSAHAELAAALADARDATAEIVEALEAGGISAAAPLIHEWRGSLFRVRLARLRLPARRTPQPASEPEPRARRPRTAVVPLVLVLAGTVAFAAGAALELWLLWSVGLALFAAALVAYRP